MAAKARPAAGWTPNVLVVVAPFAVSLGGATVTYRKGEPIHPDDPITRTHGAHLGPMRFPHWTPEEPEPADALPAPEPEA